MTDDLTCGPGCGCTPVARRTFLALATLGLAGAALAEPVRRSDAPPLDHFVPTDKMLRPEWVKTLFDKGERKVFRGAERATIGMPCGGLGAGQLYVRGDGTLGYWWIMNNGHHSSYGGQTRIATEWGDYGVCYGTYAPPTPIEQGFVIQVGKRVLSLSDKDFDDIGFIGEYPVATVTYANGKDSLPVRIEAQVFSPFIPLNARDSAIPTTILRYKVKNTSPSPQEVTVAGYLQNPVFQAQRDRMPALSRNRVVRQEGLTAVVMDALEAPRAPKPAPVTERYDDFESGYGKWTIEGECFGTEPAKGTLDGQQSVSGHTGERLVNTFLKGDTTTGKATSKPFTLRLPYISFLIGGGSDQEKLGLRLVVDGKVVRRAAGRDNERLEPGFWNVAEFSGKTAHFEIVDQATGGWGHINVDDIAFTNTPPLTDAVFSRQHPQFGDVALTCFHAGSDGYGAANLSREALFSSDDVEAPEQSARGPLSTPLRGVVGERVTLEPGAEKAFEFAICWHFPNRLQREDEGNGPGGKVGADGPRVGQRYATWFSSALDVAGYVAENRARLVGETLRFRDTLYDTTLPYWLTQRLSMPLANLATEVVQWWENGRVWCWEGVGCCTGCCGHVWNYAQGMARLFPEMERSVRVLQDFDPAHGFDAKTGAIGFRGMPGGFWAGDSQGGYVLKAYREHLTSPDDSFLKSVWPRVKQALEFLIVQDGDGDGLIEGSQHNTYDINFFGANTMVGSLYLAALKAAAKMAPLAGDPGAAARYEALARKGSESTMQRLFKNGEFFIQEVDLAKHPQHQYGDGCLSDQLLGQWFAHQLDLGYVYPEKAVKSAIKSVFTYNWAPDVGPQNRAHRPDRIFCSPGEAGLLTCTWPKSKHLGPQSVLYRDEIWTGIEYQVAAHLLHEGFPTEALAIVRGIHERYDGVKHNPFNEIECGDHYARALASWSLLLAASGFVHDGPAGTIGFAPRLNPDNFRSFFSASEGWGTFAQKREGKTLAATVTVRWGRLRLKEIALESDAATASARLNGAALTVRLRRDGARAVAVFATPIEVAADGKLELTLT